MLDALEAIFIILMPIVLIAAVVNRIMMGRSVRRLKQLLAADGRCTRCAQKVDATGACPECDQKK